MWGVDHESAWASALALQADDKPLEVGELVRHESDARRYMLRLIVNSFAHCNLIEEDGDPEYVREFPLEELVRPRHINEAEFLHKDWHIADGDLLSSKQIANKIIEMLRGMS